MKVWFKFSMLALLLVAGCAVQEQAGREIRVITKQFAYEPPEIVLKQGERVKLVVESTDVTHGFGVVEWNINRQVIPGQPLVLELRPDKPGRYEIVCTVFCGTGHGSHKGAIIVEGR